MIMMTTAGSWSAWIWSDSGSDKTDRRWGVQMVVRSFRCVLLQSSVPGAEMCNLPKRNSLKCNIAEKKET